MKLAELYLQLADVLKQVREGSLSAKDAQTKLEYLQLDARNGGLGTKISIPSLTELQALAGDISVVTYDDSYGDDSWG